MNKWSPYISLILLAAVATSFGYVLYIKISPIPEDSYYVGSTACKDCHSDEQHAWQNSLHPKMMRKASDKGVVLGDFSEDNPHVQFDLREAKWVIGSKWEQQYMGNDGTTETMLAGAWLVGQSKWNTKNWDGWKTPVPLERCHGCHTVGLNVKTGEFVEPGIGCESCHGPSSWHVETGGKGRVISTMDADVCGQCHSRGMSIDNNYFFPVGYKPGKDLDDFFDQHVPDYIQNSSNWWGNGRERKRHQEYFAWQQGGHANSLKSLLQGYDGRYGEVEDDCLRCHEGRAALDGKGSEVTLEEAKYGITCSVCHFVHGDLDKRRVDCKDCHGDGAFYHQPKKNANHVACPSTANVQCVNCHMPLTAKTGGKIQLHSHTPGIVPPSDTAKFEVPSSCANGGCHQDKELDWLQTQFETHYGKPNTVALN